MEWDIHSKVKGPLPYFGRFNLKWKVDKDDTRYCGVNSISSKK